MSIFVRLWRLVTGMFSVVLGRAERNNPEIAYENAINKLTSNYVKVKKAAASVLAHKDSVEGRLLKEREQLQLVAADLDRAVEQDKDDAALLLIQRKETIEGEVVRLEAELQEAERNFDSTKGTLNEIKGEIVRLKEERERVVANIATAKTKIAIKEQLEGLSNDTDFRALAAARENANRLLAEANIEDLMEEDNVDTQLRAIREETQAERAMEKLKALKQKKQKALPSASQKGQVIDAQFEKVPVGGKDM